MSNEQIQRLLALHSKQPVGTPVEVWHSASPQAWPPVNLYEEEGQVFVCAELPGFDGTDLSLSVEGDRFTFSAPEAHPEAQASDYVHRERGRRGFSRSIQVPYLIDPDLVSAQLEQGILKIALPPLGGFAALQEELS